MLRPFFMLLSAVLFSLHAHAGDPYWLKGKTGDRVAVEVFRSATCGCCKDWIVHLKEHNFDVTDTVVDDVAPIKQRLGVPVQAQSCHTAVIGEQVFEGHVPAQDIKRALKQPNLQLLTVPGMVSGSPGMDMPDAPKQPFRVYSLDKQGHVEVFSEYENY